MLIIKNVNYYNIYSERFVYFHTTKNGLSFNIKRLGIFFQIIKNQLKVLYLIQKRNDYKLNQLKILWRQLENQSNH